MFREAWNEAFTTENVRSAWEATGIHPFNPSRVLSVFPHPQTTLQLSPPKPKTPTSTRPIRLLLHAGEKLVTELEIVRHENQGLRKAVLHEKKKRKRGKARKAEEKKIAHNLAQQAARELLAQEKAERQAIQQAQRVQKAAETEKRKRDVAEAKVQRVRVKEGTQKVAKSKKRPLEVDESKRPKKGSLVRPTSNTVTTIFFITIFAYEIISSIVVHAIRMRSGYVEEERSGHDVGTVITR
ncbi:uncharacterized protein Z518_01536 [Rhinocladiella mackenziei CBS 650.93]|uniref:Uncharacterized protein n=1 Tax=Rhinocladiella mackenziei CBS 650.93 TaxID=1442369 RepID=A0A0D2HIF9_9EURO|nr:uncharacterized protein Z518_01536 [Rhinocladiella mackenziei CBS 650.93]KIX10453.1 hypothetical protein Z518_01536 [Rhinocladiella mackenziei CBS 650.93]